MQYNSSIGSNVACQFLINVIKYAKLRKIQWHINLTNSCTTRVTSHWRETPIVDWLLLQEFDRSRDAKTKKGQVDRLQ